MQQVSAIANTSIRYPWLYAPRYDLLFFFAPVAVALFLPALAQSSIASSSMFIFVLLTSALGAEQFHFGITSLTYFDKKNIDHYWQDPKKRRIFILFPLVIVAATMLGQFLSTALVFFIYMLWSIQHIVQQNFGILLLYHNHNKGEAVVPRKLEQWSLYATSGVFTFIFLRRVFLGDFNWFGLDFLIGLGLLVAVAFCLAYLYSLWHQIKAGAYLNMPPSYFGWFR